jgi:glycosyltransferase involved in cell wall biosynthesis
MNKNSSKEKIGIPIDSFLVLNTNRNSYRKALDITISSFLTFYKQNNCSKDIKLILNCYLKTKEGYDILNLIRTECIRLQLNYEEVMFQTIFSYSGNVPDETINLLYNACDIGINTCIGEGFGLCNMEQAGLDKPQIVSSVGGLKDIFGEIQKEAPLLIEPKCKLYTSNLQDEHGGYTGICTSEDFVKALQFYYEHKDILLEEGMRIGKYIRKKYDWKVILEDFKNKLSLIFDSLKEENV